MANQSGKFSIIQAKYSGRLYHGGYFSKGDIVVMFPRSQFVSEDESGKKTFCNTFMRLTDLQNYPEYNALRQEIREQYGIEPDTFGKMKKICRR